MLKVRTNTILTIRGLKIDQGDFFTEADVRTANRVVVLGKTVADNLFQGSDPIGQTIRIRNLPYRVIGVLSGERPVRHWAGPGRYGAHAVHDGSEEDDEQRDTPNQSHHGFRDRASGNTALPKIRSRSFCESATPFGQVSQKTSV